MIATIVIIFVMGLGLFFLWPIPFFAILVIAAHPIFWGILVVVLGIIVAAVTFLRMQGDLFNEHDEDRTKSSRNQIRALAAFLAICLFATLHWNALVVQAPTGRAVLVSAIAAAGGTAMGAVGAGLVRLPRHTGVERRAPIVRFAARASCCRIRGPDAA